MTITDVRVRLSKNNESKKKASASITIDDAFVIHDISIIEGSKGLFISMPSRKLVESGEYKDIAHPINSETREYISKMVLGNYAEVLAQTEVA